MRPSEVRGVEEGVAEESDGVPWRSCVDGSPHVRPGAQALKFRSNVGSIGIRLIRIYVIVSVFGWAPSSYSISHGYHVLMV